MVVPHQNLQLVLENKHIILHNVLVNVLKLNNAPLIKNGILSTVHVNVNVKSLLIFQTIKSGTTLIVELSANKLYHAHHPNHGIQELVHAYVQNQRNHVKPHKNSSNLFVHAIVQMECLL